MISKVEADVQVMELGLKLAIDGRARLRTVRNSQKLFQNNYLKLTIVMRNFTQTGSFLRRRTRRKPKKKLDWRWTPLGLQNNGGRNYHYGKG